MLPKKKTTKNPQKPTLSNFPSQIHPHFLSQCIAWMYFSLRPLDCFQKAFITDPLEKGEKCCSASGAAISFPSSLFPFKLHK